jgi:hypothetical protein
VIAGKQAPSLHPAGHVISLVVGIPDEHMASVMREGHIPPGLHNIVWHTSQISVVEL